MALFRYTKKRDIGQSREAEEVQELATKPIGQTAQQIFKEKQQEIESAAYTYIQTSGYGDPDYMETYGGSGGNAGYMENAYSPQEGKYNIPLTEGLRPVVGKMNFSNDWKAQRAGHLHQGNDIFAPRGTHIIAVRDGIITKAGNDGGKGGNRIWLRDNVGNTYYYAHNETNAVKEGQKVSQGQIIGTVGNSGNAVTTPTHVHFEFHPDGKSATNPYLYLKQGQNVTPVKMTDKSREMPFGDLIYNAAKKYKVPANILYGVLKQESGFDPETIYSSKGNSTAGAQGIAQMIPSTWKEAWNEYRDKSPFNPKYAIPAAAKYLRLKFDDPRLPELMKIYPNTSQMRFALSLYNSGDPRGLFKFKETVKYFPAVERFAREWFYRVSSKPAVEAIQSTLPIIERAKANLLGKPYKEKEKIPRRPIRGWAL